MKTELVLFGRHFKMASQARRRRLVRLVYAGFAFLMVAGWFLDHWHTWGLILIIFPATNASRLVFGGYGVGGRGLIKPFLGNEVSARYAINPHSSWSRLSKLTIPNITDEREFCSDEREVHRRDSAHEVAYRRLGMVVIVAFMVAFFKNAALPFLLEYGISFPDVFFDQLIYGLLIASLLLFLTLPQAILLWNEPDMEEPQ